MTTPAIAELERIAASDDLICPLPYDNPGRDRRYLFDYVQEYGHSLDIDVGRHEFGFLEDVRAYAAAITNSLSDPYLPRGQKAFFSAFGFISLIIRPPFYPLVGGTAHCNLGGGIVRVCVPSYQGIYGLIFDAEAHEIQHAYHYLAVLDLFERELIQSEGNIMLPLIEPSVTVPDKKGLKALERSFLRHIISVEKKYLARQEP